MTAAVVALAAVLAVALAATALTAARASAARRMATAEANRRRALEAAVAQLGAAVAQLRARYAPEPPPPGSPGPAPPVEPPPPGPAAPATDEHALVATAWALAGLAQRWADHPAPEASGETGPGGTGVLQAALDAEVARIREEVGTPGSVRCALDEPPSPGVALVTLHALRLTLDALARRSDAFDLYVHEWEGRVAAIVVCDGFDGRRSVEDAAAEIDAALHRCGGALVLDWDSRDRLRARLSVPRDPL